jgi:spermidine synthase
MTVFRESLHKDLGQTLWIDEVLHKGRTRHQNVMVFTNPTFGRVLALDGVVQFTERDHHIYHEMIAHVPLMAHPAPRDVLIIGGGDGGVLKEVLKHPIRSAVLVEIDPEVIALSRTYFPEISQGAFDNRRALVVIDEGAAYVEQAKNRFDVVIVDSTDSIGPGESLFSESFYENVRSVLRPGGIVAVQSGAPFYRARRLDRMLSRLAGRFGFARAFLAPVPTYAHGLLALIVAAEADAFCPPVDLLRGRSYGIDTAYYTPEVHHAAFVMAPSFDGEAGESQSELPDWVTRPLRLSKATVAP